MKNHKYFASKEEYNEWLDQNPKIYIVDITKLDNGVYIDYIQGNVNYKHSRTRKWKI